MHWDSGTNWFDPLVLDLAGDGIATTGADDPVSFDLDADGRPELLQWVGGDDAFLWTDLNGNNRVDDGAELFGVGTDLPDGSKARHGYEALAVYDRADRGGDGNGHIDQNDAIWNHLRLWRDEDHDGICDGGERAPIHRFGVESIDLDYREIRRVDSSGVLHLLGGTYRKGNVNSVDLLVEALVFRGVANDEP